jgi:hypothetical protein
MKSLKLIWLMLILVTVAGCTFEFFPDTEKNEELIVIEGMITNQNRVNKIMVSKSTQTGTALTPKPVTGAVVTITDENGNVTTLSESADGIYSTDSTTFTGHVGGLYSLEIGLNNNIYKTDPIEMKPVPEINSLYYEKVVIKEGRDSSEREEGCRIYLDSYDPNGACMFFRWDYVETWEYVIPYAALNKVCWITNTSDEVLIKNTSNYSQSRVTKFPVLFISNKTDRLKETYSILVNQYSLNEEEYNFWEQVKNISQNVGSPYDVTPSAIPGNIKCITDPGETVLGYFSVSAVAQKRLYIKELFMGMPNFYTYCATDTVMGELPQTGLNSDFWVIEDFSDELPPFWVISTFRECADCTVRGTNIRPPFWDMK